MAEPPDRPHPVARASPDVCTPPRRLALPSRPGGGVGDVVPAHPPPGKRNAGGARSNRPGHSHHFHTNQQRSLPSAHARPPPTTGPHPTAPGQQSVGKLVGILAASEELIGSHVRSCTMMAAERETADERTTRQRGPVGQKGGPRRCGMADRRARWLEPLSISRASTVVRRRAVSAHVAENRDGGALDVPPPCCEPFMPPACMLGL